jgi:hypothetical protein
MLNGFLKFVAGKWTNITVSEVNPLPVNIVNDNSPVSSSNPLLVQNPNAAPIDRSSSITTGGAAQVAMAALSTRKAYFLQNVSSEIMWGSFTGTAAPNAAGSFPIQPNGIIRSTQVCETTALSIYGETTGKVYTAWEM